MPIVVKLCAPPSRADSTIGGLADDDDQSRGHPADMVATAERHGRRRARCPRATPCLPPPTRKQHRLRRAYLPIPLARGKVCRGYSRIDISFSLFVFFKNILRRLIDIYIRIYYTCTPAGPLEKEDSQPARKPSQCHASLPAGCRALRAATSRFVRRQQRSTGT